LPYRRTGHLRLDDSDLGHGAGVAFAVLAANRVVVVRRIDA
jgi:hypothetical protein